MADDRDSGERTGRWSGLSVAAQIAAILGVPIGLATIVLAWLALKPDPNNGPAGNGSPPPPSVTPAEDLEASWAREQGRLCVRLNQEAAANQSGASADLAAQLPTLRAASATVGRFVADSTALDVPDSLRPDVQTMLGHWSEGMAYMTGMLRSAEQGDTISFDQRLEQFNGAMEQGMGIARRLGASPCS
jgi:hypothetical protein